MTNEANRFDIRSAWQTEEANAADVTAGELRARIERLSRRTSGQTLAGVIASVIVLVAFAYIWRLTAATESFARAGILMTYAGMATFAWQLMSHSRRQKQDWSRMSERGGAPTLAFHRYQLERQRDFHRGWSLCSRLLALAPGPLLFCVSFGAAHPEVARAYYVNALIVVVVCALAVWVNLRLARRYQAQLDGLTRLS